MGTTVRRTDRRSPDLRQGVIREPRITGRSGDGGCYPEGDRNANRQLARGRTAGLRRIATTACILAADQMSSAAVPDFSCVCDDGTPGSDVSWWRILAGA